MSLYTIADLHLSTLASTNKSMEVFGHRWQDYTERLKNAWQRLVTDEDTVVIPGDVSWALTLEEAVSDLKFVESLPGRKIIGKGNHDFWWTTVKKHEALFEKEGIKSISFLFNNAYVIEDFIVAGTRGWYQDEDAKNAPDNADFDKLTARETGRLKLSLDAALKLKQENPEKETVVFMHFPPVWNGKVSNPLIEVLKEYGIRRVYFGHIHGAYSVPESFIYEGIEMTLISADYLSFIPKIVTKKEI